MPSDARPQGGPTDSRSSGDASEGSSSTTLTPDEFSAAVSAVTTAFGDATRRDIYLFVRERSDPNGGVTASEVAEAFSLHANVARHHLDKLAAGGYLVVDLVRSESAGRPSKRYRAPDLDHLLLTFPPRRDHLIGTLLARAIERLEPDEARAMAEEVGFEYGLGLAEQMSPNDSRRSRKSALTAVAEALTAHGFAAHAEARGDELTIVNEHCAFGTAAQQYPHVLCAIDRGMIRGMFTGLHGSAEPEFIERRPEGADHCVATVR